MRLDWDPPLDDGGVAINRYQISIDTLESEMMITTDDTETVTTFSAQKSVGEYLVQIRAVNCAGVSKHSSITVASFTGSYNYDNYGKSKGFIAIILSEDSTNTTGKPTAPLTTELEANITTLSTIGMFSS